MTTDGRSGPGIAPVLTETSALGVLAPDDPLVGLRVPEECGRVARRVGRRGLQVVAGTAVFRVGDLRGFHGEDGGPGRSAVNMGRRYRHDRPHRSG